KEGGPAPIQNSARASESCCSGSLCVPQVSASGCADRCRAKRGGRMAAVSVAAAGEAGVVALTDEPPSASGAAADRAAELDDSAAPGGHLEPVLASRADRAGARGPAPAGVPRRAGALPRVAGAEPWRMAPRRLAQTSAPPLAGSGRPGPGRPCCGGAGLCSGVCCRCRRRAQGSRSSGSLLRPGS
ncbi:unnamed protein product, partial [Prorocentrum cordatum]